MTTRNLFVNFVHVHKYHYVFLCCSLYENTPGCSVQVQNVAFSVTPLKEEQEVAEMIAALKNVSLFYMRMLKMTFFLIVLCVSICVYVLLFENSKY